MTRTNVIVGGVLGFFVLYALMLYFTWRPIEQDIAQRTAVELQAGAHQWATVQTHQRGRDVLLIGSAPSELAAAQAVAMAHKSWGVRAVEARIDVAPTASLAPPSLPASVPAEDRLKVEPVPNQVANIALRAGDGEQLIAAGRVPDRAIADAILAALANAYGAGRVVDHMEIDDGTQTEPWLAEIPGLISDLQGVDTAFFAIADGRIAIQGMVGDEQQRSEVVGAVSARFGQHLVLDDDLVVAAASSPAAPADTAPAPAVVPATVKTVPVKSCQRRFDELLQRKKIGFASGSAKLQPDSVAVLDDVAAILGDCPASRVRIEGHTDATGSARNNDRLSQQRAASVRDYLVAKGLDRARFEVVGVGSREPVADNASAAGRALNRRIELRVVR